MKRSFLAVLLGFVAGLTAIEVAWAHSGSPSPTTWANGQTLTATALNDTIAHLHNTLSGAIANANISPTAAIAHTKLATPALVPKAWGFVDTNCVGGGAADSVTCTLTDSAGVTSVKNNGATGQYRVTLNYTPVNNDFAMITTSHVSAVMCSAVSPLTASPHFIVDCRDTGGAGANAAFSFLVMDSL